MHFERHKGRTDVVFTPEDEARLGPALKDAVVFISDMVEYARRLQKDHERIDLGGRDPKKVLDFFISLDDWICNVGRDASDLLGEINQYLREAEKGE